MKPIERIQSLTKQITWIIAVHAALLIIYHYTYGVIDLYYDLTSYMPILLLFCMAPLIAVFVLSTQFARQGAVVLLGILPAALIYHIVTRFTSFPPIIQVEPAQIWQVLYEVSFGLILILEAVAIWLTFKLLREIHQQTDTQVHNSSEKK